MSRLSKVLVYLLVLVIYGAFVNEICFASDDGDFQWWSTADFSFDVSKVWKFKFQEELRLEESGGHLYYHHSDAGLVYTGFADWIDLGFNYRQVFEKDSKGNAGYRGGRCGLDTLLATRGRAKQGENTYGLPKPGGVSRYGRSV